MSPPEEVMLLHCLVSFNEWINGCDLIEVIASKIRTETICVVPEDWNPNSLSKSVVAFTTRGGNHRWDNGRIFALKTSGMLHVCMGHLELAWAGRKCEGTMGVPFSLGLVIVANLKKFRVVCGLAWWCCTYRQGKWKRKDGRGVRGVREILDDTLQWSVSADRPGAWWRKSWRSRWDLRRGVVGRKRTLGVASRDLTRWGGRFSNLSNGQRSWWRTYGPISDVALESIVGWFALRLFCDRGNTSGDPARRAARRRKIAAKGLNFIWKLHVKNYQSARFENLWRELPICLMHISLAIHYTETCRVGWTSRVLQDVVDESEGDRWQVLEVDCWTLSPKEVMSILSRFAGVVMWVPEFD